MTAGHSPIPERYAALTEKEKETLRLMVRGHDAKSAANELSLSVHTINERLKMARRKLEVTSSREAARLVLEREGGDPEYFVSEDFGDAPSPASGDDGFRRSRWPANLVIAGGIIMLAVLAVLALTPQVDAVDNSSGVEASPDAQAEIAAAAREFLELVDVGDWQASFDAAGKQFREVNTVDGWADASRQARAPYGSFVSRELAAVRYLNAPPHGYQEVTFTSQFANGSDVTETVTLQREDGAWKMVGILID